jgi:hypothetical protein
MKAKLFFEDDKVVVRTIPLKQHLNGFFIRGKNRKEN